MAKYQVLYHANPNFSDPVSPVDLEAYECVTALEAKGPDDVFCRMQAIYGEPEELPVQLKCRSMSVGDLVKDTETGELHGCCGSGWNTVQAA